MVLRTYFSLTKPGIIIGNLITAAAGFFLASQGHINFLLLFATLLGISLIIASACVFNNWLDQDIDAKMERTRRRAMVLKSVPVLNALVYGTILGLAGSIILIRFVNLETFLIGFIGFFFYVFLYTPIKRRSVYGTLVGSISGATPPAAGYVAVTNHYDIGAFLLFILLVFWQMPHFYAIAIYRLSDYKKAKIPVLPIVSGIKVTKIHMLFYIIAFAVVALLLRFLGVVASDVYVLVAVVLSIYWLKYLVRGLRASDNKVWARGMFKYSLKLITILCVVISLDAFLKNII